ncbi:hypothetical protein, partial [Rhodococcus sp. HS-D2]|uniref:hypothetical protein n=1 Tax=Rhodococcus sp. HS-D2 TaxID=1384636 RepID=UPI001E4200E7
MIIRQPLFDTHHFRVKREKHQLPKLKRGFVRIHVRNRSTIGTRVTKHSVIGGGVRLRFESEPEVLCSFGHRWVYNDSRERGFLESTGKCVVRCCRCIARLAATRAELRRMIPPGIS